MKPSVFPIKEVRENVVWGPVLPFLARWLIGPAAVVIGGGWLLSKYVGEAISEDLKPLVKGLPWVIGSGLAMYGTKEFPKEVKPVGYVTAGILGIIGLGTMTAALGMGKRNRHDIVPGAPPQAPMTETPETMLDVNLTVPPKAFFGGYWARAAVTNNAPYSIDLNGRFEQYVGSDLEQVYEPRRVLLAPGETFLWSVNLAIPFIAIFREDRVIKFYLRNVATQMNYGPYITICELNDW